MNKDLLRNPKYLQASIVELEAIYDGSNGQVSVLDALLLELSFRSTDRAERLRSKIKSRYPTSAKQLSNIASNADGADLLDLGAGSQLSESFKENNHALGSDALDGLPDEIPTLVELSHGSVGRVPQTDNEPAAILSTWTALEALDPVTYRRPFDLVGGDRRRIVDMKGTNVPWPNGRSIPNYALFYQIPLGTIGMGKATQALVNSFGANEEQNPRQTERAVMAAVLVDRNGIPLEENSVAISSLTWALPEALKGNLSLLGDWANIEQTLVRALQNILQTRDADGNAMPLTRARIDIAHDWLKRQFDLDESMVEPTAFAIKKYHYYKSKDLPEVELLNSFFLRDLERARSAVSVGKETKGLGRYLGQNRPRHVPDLLSDNSAIEEAVSPAKVTPSRWPSPGGFPLVLLQQAAVNLARHELAGAEGITSVNGPPGTGKTTLLRDVVAGCVLDRAKAMAAFSDPVKAFSPSGEKIAMGSNAFFHLYRLDPSLKGHEIIVASSNNKAVENVSRELPAREAIGRGIDDLSYLRTLSNRVYASPNKETEAPDPEADTWGMIAAVLGNGKNRGAFVQSFWWDQDCGIQMYLKAAQGKPTVREIRDEDGKIIRRETPTIVTQEKPPSPDLAKRNWSKARRRFQTVLAEVEQELADLEKIRDIVRKLSGLRESRFALLADCDAASEVEHGLVSTLHEQRAIQVRTEKRLASVQDALRDHDAERPGFFARLFRVSSFRMWKEKRKPLLAERDDAKSEDLKAQRNVTSALANHQQQVRILEELKGAVTYLEMEISKSENLLTPWRDRLGDRIVDDAFFERGHEVSHLAAPWIPDELHQKREEVFIAAMALHQAFIDATAQKMQHNTAVLMKALQDGSLLDEDKRALLPDLWSTLFSIVPVISTTFASVDRMMADLPAGSIGWLLVDEAGQATPQAAVGAIMRSKRTIVVGDPLQIPPVVTLPEQLVSMIAKEFKVDPLEWTAPMASTQTVADQASNHQGEFRGDAEPRRVGIPLLVHRRCQDPMFGISNEVAYDGQMVHAAGTSSPGSVTEAIGRSRWFDIDGEAETKWCPAEGDLAVRLLQELAYKGASEPDLFIISPFRDVANGIRNRLRSEAALFDAMGVGDLDEWLSDRVGTVHTVQGREAEAVFFVLGAPSAAHGGARAWAGNSPNIVNVAVSRAKQSLYVIGSHGAWSGVGHFRTLANDLPIAEKRSEVS